MSMLDSFRLDGRVALVTGASQGLGQAMAVGLAEAGADIAGLDRTLDCAETCDQVPALGRRFSGFARPSGVETGGMSAWRKSWIQSWRSWYWSQPAV